jgi:hypothetical protein
MTVITTQGQRRVSFSPKVVVRKLTHIRDLEQEEKDEISWFSKNHETACIRASCRKTVDRMTRGQRLVSFYPKVVVHRLTHIHDLEQGEKDEIWFSKQEMVCIRASWSETVGRMKMGLEHLEAESTRGLEWLVENPKDKRLSQQTVIQEQNRQIEQSGCCDEETLSREYQIFSWPSQVRAYKRAIEDRRALLEGGRRVFLEERRRALLEEGEELTSYQHRRTR